MEEIAQLISTLGFPIAVAVWLLYRDYKTMKKIEAGMSALDRRLERFEVLFDKYLNGRLSGSRDGE